MAEICCGTKASPATVAAVSPSSSRRRRMEIRRFRFGADASELTEQEIKQKRQKIELAAPPPAVHETATTKEIGSDALTVTAADPAGKISACPAYGTTSVCGRRRDMEDAVSVHPSFFRRGTETEEEFHFFGVFDGHGCSHVATACKDRMHKMLAEELEALPPSPPSTAALEWKDAMEKAFGRMDDAAVVSRHPPKTADCRCELQLPKCDHVGSTAVVAVVGGDRIIVGNCGDSRAVLCRKGVAVPLSIDHKPDRPDELERIEAAGGRVIFWEGARVLGVLAMSRAIGDGYLKPFVTAEPEVTVTERTEDDECLIMASDGLWDVVSNEMACDIVRMCLRGSRPGGGGGDVAAPDRRCADAAMLLTKLALARQSADNVSVVVVDLRTRGGR